MIIEFHAFPYGCHIDIFILAVDGSHLLLIDPNRSKPQDTGADIRQPPGIGSRRKNKGRRGHIRKHLFNTANHRFEPRLGDVRRTMKFVFLTVHHFDVVLPGKPSQLFYVFLQILLLHTPQPDPCGAAAAALIRLNIIESAGGAQH